MQKPVVDGEVERWIPAYSDKLQRSLQRGDKTKNSVSSLSWEVCEKRMKGGESQARQEARQGRIAKARDSRTTINQLHRAFINVLLSEPGNLGEGVEVSGGRSWWTSWSWQVNQGSCGLVGQGKGLGAGIGEWQERQSNGKEGEVKLINLLRHWSENELWMRL